MVVVNIPAIDNRKCIPQESIDQVVQQIVEKFKRKGSSCLARMRAALRA